MAAAQIGPTRSLYACAAVNADNGALSGRCWPAHILGAAELYAENPWPDTPEVFTATHQALESLADAPGGPTQRRLVADVTAEPVELIVNIGDMMQRWTNNRWLSDEHRVVRSPRGAGACFLHPSCDAEIACLPTCSEPATRHATHQYAPATSCARS